MNRKDILGMMLNEADVLIDELKGFVESRGTGDTPLREETVRLLQSKYITRYVDELQWFVYQGHKEDAKSNAATILEMVQNI